MPRVGLGLPCPNCGNELSVEGGLAPNAVREAIRLRAADSGLPITCDTCGCEVVLKPIDGKGWKIDFPSSE